ncbi:MAG: SsrA-binding protein SmpB [Candidatus Marinimicrobia bacterium]|jgi:SsrA-binding protein|nr:SsrA-binding protein SmpB [Candidatus Neomarinimicrobiota bacterium]MBT3947170.1 SsrA-binding protein SmpB [Candidatus Neomarinimicrobiota bacterium]MBT4064199.1 SsrA-binding protein SmpB [Candidatus Neomarinimicrobiota bacterium]MBT4308257.1 SsrA-binding protein SmpB [Candidatus Neomarinimicrobiota bacterium]MBT4452629.1 SsrA-binding protein SmpB [Candidatus Neomarinimicrobiota bacterium]|tara:strand:- start:3594 stop:4052 length:459 start_codon:yes stop_codon:yes gene_type:complete
MPMDIQIAATNRKAYHEYHILDKYEAGIELVGSEVKSLREGSANLKEAYIVIRKGEAFAVGIHISPYSHTGIEGHDPVRDRRLLLHRREIKKIKDLTDQKGLTAIPLQMYFNPNGRAKLEIGIAKGKKTYDKKKSIKEKDLLREAQRELRNR